MHGDKALKGESEIRHSLEYYAYPRAKYATETAFAKPDDCPDASETIIVGIDPGEVKTASATRIGRVNDP